MLLQHPTTALAQPGRPRAPITTSSSSNPATTTSTTSSSSSSTPPVNLAKPRWLVAKDAFDLAGPETSQAIYKSLAGDRFPAVTALLGQPTEVNLATATAPAATAGGSDDGSSSNSSALAAAGLTALTDWPEVFRVVQAWEVWGQHGGWVQEHKPEFGPGIKERFAMAAAITEEEWREQDGKRTL